MPPIAANERDPSRGPYPGRALVIDNDPQRSRSIARALRAAVAEVVVRPSGAQQDGDGAWDLVAFDHESTSPEERHRLLLGFADVIARQRLIVYSANYEDQGLGQLLGQYGIGHAVACEGSHDLERLRITACKALEGDLFGLHKYLGWGALRQTLGIRSCAERPDIMDACAHLAQRVGMRERRAEAFATLADELVTNALYNAPTDARGQHRFRQVDRRTEVVLEPGEDIVVVLGADVDRAGVSVTDPFGSVTARHLVQTLGHCLAARQRTPQRAGGGAGLGLFHAYQASSHLAFNITRGKRTEAIGILDVASSNREFKRRAKSLSMFEDGTGGADRPPRAPANPYPEPAT